MIPEHLKGKNAIQICNEMRYRAFRNHTIETPVMENYLEQLEMLLLLAVKDALCNISSGDHQFGQYGIGTKRGIHAEQRAITFLNMVLLYEGEK